VRSYEIPIRIRALKTANIYVVETESRKILVDSGMGPEVDNFLKFSGEDAKTFDLIILSHLHIDHIGGAVHLRSKYGIPVGMGAGDIDLMNRIKGDPNWFEKSYTGQLKENGMPEALLNKYTRETPIMREIDYYQNFEVDERLDGNYSLGTKTGIKLIDVPGHSPGSICVYLPNEKTIFTGDHVLRNISPNISKYVGIRDSLGSYLSSLEKLADLETEYVLPGHGMPFNSLHDRVSDLISHHRARLDEIIEIDRDWYSAYEIAGRMKWSKGRSMDSMNTMETIFAVGEATSHLERLEEEGKVKATDRDGVKLYKTST